MKRGGKGKGERKGKEKGREKERENKMGGKGEAKGREDGLEKEQGEGREGREEIDSQVYKGGGRGRCKRGRRVERKRRRRHAPCGVGLPPTK